MSASRTVTVLVLVLVTACARSGDGARARAAASPTPRSAVSAPSPSATIAAVDTPLGRSIRLPELPAQGIAVDRGGGVVFVGLDGVVVARLPGFHLGYAWTVPGRVVLRRHPHEFFVLREHAHTVVPIGDRDVAPHVSPQFQTGFEPDGDPGLPYPAGSRVPGHPGLRGGWWVYALPSPDGSLVLAQWSGECEVPTAFFVDGRSVVTVDGFERIGPAADSWALGWTRDGRAVVTLSGGPCSSPFRRPGVYLLDGPGDGELLLATAGAARMWNPA